MREETLINAVNDIDDIRWKLEDIHQNIMEQPDYWEKLKHQYAGMAMQGILSNNELLDDILRGVYPPDKPQYLSNVINNYATALVNKLKKD